MENNSGVKLFISYSHEDNKGENSYIDEFIKYIYQLKNNSLISEIWYDRKILGGDNFREKIDPKIENANVICLFLSKNFSFSSECRDEERIAFELKKEKNITVVPIILTKCGWKDDEYISKDSILALPTDGKTISEFSSKEDWFMDVYEGLKKIIQKNLEIKNLKIKKEFENSLQDVGVISLALSQKEKVELDEIFIFPDLDKLSNLKEKVETINFEKLLDTILNYKKIIIEGEEQSGKTTICKMFFKKLRDMNFIPVYISDPTNNFFGKMENRIKKSLMEQYIILNIDNFYDNYKDKIIPIIDNFQFAKDKEKHLKDISDFPLNIIIVDLVYGLNIGEEETIISFNYFRIKGLKPSLRYLLIKKWLEINNRVDADNYKMLDKKVKTVETIVGKNLGNGIMPIYPFSLLFLVSIYEAVTILPNQEIVSQSSCYEALIFFYLKKHGAKNDEIDSYFNFLTEISFYIYENKKYQLSQFELDSFLELYTSKFNFVIDKETFFDVLAQIFSKNSFSNYSFKYLYIYYFFISKYLAGGFDKNLDGINEKIDNILQNLQINENAYIFIFLTYHSKNIKILEKIELNAKNLFSKYSVATLKKDEVIFFDKQTNLVLEAILQPKNTTPESERKKSLEIQDKKELALEKENGNESMQVENNGDLLRNDIRKAIKIVEVIGQIMKNKSGSLEISRLETLFKIAMDVYLRFLSSFLNFVEDTENQKKFINYIIKSIAMKDEKETSEEVMNEEERGEFAKKIYWSLGFMSVCVSILGIISSLGSDKLIMISNKVCDETATPASFLVKQGILMSYSKNVQILEIISKIKELDFSELAKQTMCIIISNYRYLHIVGYQEKQQIEYFLDLASGKVFQNTYKKQL